MNLKTQEQITNSWTTDKTIVSICCTAYNHEKYIEQTIQSFLMQETNFAFEILISDDCSTDNTTNIIQRYVQQYPKIIKHLHQAENKYSKGALPIRDLVLPYISGEYIALCEGDDFWTNSTKLQQQIDFLEKNREYTGCGHNTGFLENGELSGKLFINPTIRQTKYYFDDIVDGFYMHTSSMVYRYNDEIKNLADEYFAKYSNVDRNDSYMLLVFAKLGPVGYINKVMSTYRVNDDGIWSGSADEVQISMFLKGCVDFSHIFGERVAYRLMRRFAVTISNYIESISSKSTYNLLEKIDTEDYPFIVAHLALLKKEDLAKIEHIDNVCKQQQEELLSLRSEIDKINKNKLCYFLQLPFRQKVYIISKKLKIHK